MIFVIFSIVGFIYETILEYIQTGNIFSKQELMYGPFTIVYGIGAVIFTILAKKFKNMAVIFLIASFWGGLLEYLYSFFKKSFMEQFLRIIQMLLQILMVEQRFFML